MVSSFRMPKTTGLREHREMKRLAEVCVGSWWQEQKVRSLNSVLPFTVGPAAADCCWVDDNHGKHIWAAGGGPVVVSGQGFSLDGCAGTLKPVWEECRVTWFTVENNLYRCFCWCPFLMCTGQLMKELQGLFEALNILWVYNVGNQLSSVGALSNRCYKKKSLLDSLLWAVMAQQLGDLCIYF